MIQKNKTPESPKAGLMKVIIYSAATIVLYYIVFTHSQYVLDVVFSKHIQAPALVIAVTLLASGLYGTAANKFFKHTLEKKLASQLTREE